MTTSSTFPEKESKTQVKVTLHSLPRHGDSAEKTKLITNNTSGINTEIKVNGQKLEAVISFKYLGSVITDEGSKPEMLSRIAKAAAALTKLKSVWNDRSISLSSKLRLMHSLLTSMFLYACDPHSRAPKKNTSL